MSMQHLVVANIAGITLIGDNLNQSIIQCFGFAFLNVTDLVLWNLKFVGCGANMSGWITCYVNRTSPDPTFRSTSHMVDVWNADIWAIDIYHSYRSTGIVVLGVVNLGYSDFVNNPINLLLRADDSAEYLIDTRIRIEEYVLFWRAETYGLYTVFQQQEYDISLELQNVAVQNGD